MSRYADVDALMQSIRHRLGIASLDNLLESEKAIVKEIDSAPSIDIVYCEECKKWRNGWCYKYGRAFWPFDFCSYGERSE